MSNKKYLIVVGGPTASGKTAFAVQVAQHFRTEIVSCDSRQFYQEMNIGTAKPTPEEMQGVPHHFIGHRSIVKPYSVGDFEKEALELLQHLYEKYDFVIAVGGSGLYLKALCEGLDTFPQVPAEVRREVRQLYETAGLAGLQQAVQTADPDYFVIVDQQNPHRLLRALEVTWATGQPFSGFRKQEAKERFFTPVYIELSLPREVLYDRINRRVDAMMEKGLLEEVQALFPQRHLTALQTVGYQELFEYLEGKWSLEEAVEKIKQNSRNYAKRQLTWWRRDGFWRKFAPEEAEAAIQWALMVL
jgi:tRNA dimethylallyltransferase